MYPLGALKHFFIGLEKVELDEGALSMLGFDDVYLVMFNVGR